MQVIGDFQMLSSHWKKVQNTCQDMSANGQKDTELVHKLLYLWFRTNENRHDDIGPAIQRLVWVVWDKTTLSELNSHDLLFLDYAQKHP